MRGEEQEGPSRWSLESETFNEEEASSMERVGAMDVEEQERPGRSMQCMWEEVGRLGGRTTLWREATVAIG